ncbi:type-2 histone deacetylase 1-like [Danaus plexippus]|uniref:type-2 histone deacetylase 1-like n=1 Tax=Danaus plexippus TaxID=13037 RepID=UPI002AB2CC05|nr:type-2 histone deacetylase 1-like [Danaus plexippus]
MAQNEDTELRDLVLDALEKNGSLAKIRALLRANLFLVFEDECHIKQNEALDKILNLPEGKLCFSIVHEFLEFCNLRNTLFVYKSETRQGNEYEYQNENILREKLYLSKCDDVKEPILLSLIKRTLNLEEKNEYQINDKHHNSQNKIKKKFGTEENCTYTVQEDSCASSQSNSDNSSEKLDLRLQLENSDTDTSSSSKGKSCSEYIPNKITKKSVNINKINIKEQKNNINETTTQNITSFKFNNESSQNYLQDIKVANNSSDSTSYAELKPFNSRDSILLNTTGLPLSLEKEVNQVSPQHNSNSTSSKIETLSLNQTLSSRSENITKSNNQNSSKNSIKKSPHHEIENNPTEYSYDFTSPLSDRKESSGRNIKNQEIVNNAIKTDTHSPKQNSMSSQSSVSISDVADLISENNSKTYHLERMSVQSKTSNSNIYNKSPREGKTFSDDSGDFSESPIPSLSNLSLDIHSE